MLSLERELQHLAQDIDLPKAASIVEERVKPITDLVTHYGREEFFVIVPTHVAQSRSCVLSHQLQQLLSHHE